MRLLFGALAVVALVAHGAAERAPAQSTLAHVTIAPAKALIDDPVDLRVTGLRPGKPVTLVANTVDRQGRRWSSSLVVRSNRDGVVDTHASMKLFWSLRAVKRLPDTEATFVPPDGPVGVDVGVIVGGRRVASAWLIRSGVAPDLVGTTATLARQGFIGTYAARPNRPPAPAVLIIGGSLPGYSPEYAEHIASHGYPSLAIAYWGAPGLPQELKEIPLEYFQRALAWLASQPGVDPHRIAVLGISYGVGAAILSAAHYPSLVAGVIGCTGGFEIPALPPSDGSAWTLAGAPIPPGPLPVEKVTGPVLLFGGGKDEIDQTALAARRLVERAHSFGHTNVTARIYPLAGHGAGCRFPNQPLSTFLQVRPHIYAELGGTAEANEEAAADGWARILRFRFLASLP